MVDEPTEEVDEALLLDARRHPGVLACIAVGGALGALSRYGMGRVIAVPVNGFPRSTFVVNLSGAFALGCFLTVLHGRRWPAHYLRPLIAIGFLGAFTTFSTMAVETVTLIKDDHAAVGLAYLCLSVALGLASCALGILVGRAASGSDVGSA